MLFNYRKYSGLTRQTGPNARAHLLVAEGYEAVITIVEKCSIIAFRHLPRAHETDVIWLFEVCSAPDVQLRRVEAYSQTADLMAKAFAASDKLASFLRIAHIYSDPAKLIVGGVVGGILAGARQQRRLFSHLPLPFFYHFWLYARPWHTPKGGQGRGGPFSLSSLRLCSLTSPTPSSSAG